MGKSIIQSPRAIRLSDIPFSKPARIVLAPQRYHADRGQVTRSEPGRLAGNYGGDPRKEYLHFFGLGVDGVFSEFPDTAVEARVGGVAVGNARGE